jgi:hypothetical protein
VIWVALSLRDLGRFEPAWLVCPGRAELGYLAPILQSRCVRLVSTNEMLFARQRLLQLTPPHRSR